MMSGESVAVLAGDGVDSSNPVAPTLLPAGVTRKEPTLLIDCHLQWNVTPHHISRPRAMKGEGEGALSSETPISKS